MSTSNSGNVYYQFVFEWLTGIDNYSYHVTRPREFDVTGVISVISSSISIILSCGYINGVVGINGR